MSQRPSTATRTPPRVLLTRQEAADALGMSLSHFQRHVQPQLDCVYSGQLRRYRPRDLEEWVDRNLQGPAAMVA